MAWFNSIIGGGTANNYINPAATPSGMLSSATTSAGSILQSNSAQSYWGAQQSQVVHSTHHHKMYTVMQYAEEIGWEITHHHVPVGMTSDDPKIAMLKLVNVGEVLKDVGVRTSDNDYYIMREPSK